MLAIAKTDCVERLSADDLWRAESMILVTGGKLKKTELGNGD